MLCVECVYVCVFSVHTKLVLSLNLFPYLFLSPSLVRLCGGCVCVWPNVCRLLEQEALRSRQTSTRVLKHEGAVALKKPIVATLPQRQVLFGRRDENQSSIDCADENNANSNNGAKNIDAAHVDGVQNEYHHANDPRSLRHVHFENRRRLAFTDSKIHI